MASIISQACLEQGLILIMQLFLVLCGSLRSPSQFWVHHIPKQLPLASHSRLQAKLASEHQGMQLRLPFRLPNAYNTITLQP